MLPYMQSSAMTLAESSYGNPVISTCVVMLFYIMFCVVEGQVEKLVFGERFEHALDPVFALGFIAYAAYGVWACAVFNSTR